MSSPERATRSTRKNLRSSQPQACELFQRRLAMPVRRGEIYWVEYDPMKGSEQGGLRPALVVQNDTGNASSPTTVVAAMTRRIPSRRYPFSVVVEPHQS